MPAFGTEGTRKRVDGGSEEHKATITSAAEGPMLVEGLRAGENRVWRAKPMWMVL